MNNPHSLVLLVDDDPSIQKALTSLFRSVGLAVEVFGSVEEFLQRQLPDVPCCLVLDVRLPGISGLNFQRQLATQENAPQVIFITGHGDIPMSVQAMRDGAVDFLTKPFRDQDLLDAIHKALQRDRVARGEQARTAELRKRYGALTSREKQVLTLVLSGQSNKQIAFDLGTSENTVKVHRSNLMRKMRAANLVELIRVANALHMTAAAQGRSADLP